ncbi:MAG: hypothetical protein IIB55_01100 [Planctomycetes bacterium]|nr:hypothetical protein [Planctomycetota bacterium]
MRKQYVLGTLCAASMACAVHAQGSVTVTVYRWDQGVCIGGIEKIEVLDPGESWSYNMSSCANRVNIEPSNNSVNIGRITLSGGSSVFPVAIYLGNRSTHGFGAPPVKVGNNWAGLNAWQVTTSVLYGGINGNLTGTIHVEDLDRFDAGGQIQAQVRANDAWPAGFIVAADSTGPNGSIYCVNGRILDVVIANDVRGWISAATNIRFINIGGDLLNSVDAGGTIAEINVTGHLLNNVDAGGKITEINVGGDIGTPGSFVSITTTGDGSDIDLITADAIYANITTPNTANPRGDVDRLITTVGDFRGSLTTFAMQGVTIISVPAVSIAGNLVADISVATIKRPVNIAGDLVSGASITYAGASRDTGGITILGDLGGLLSFNTSNAGQNDADITLGTSGTPGSILSTGRISVDKDIEGDITVYGDMSGVIDIGTTLTGDISIGASGLEGQVIINSDDDSGMWTGNVTVGATTLLPKGAYLQTGLGGGAVGLVAFDCHLQDCDPPYSSASPPVSPILGGDPDNATPFEVTLTHYGPVTWTSGMPIKIMYCTGVVCDAPADVSSDFEVAHAAGSRDILITVKSGSTAEVGFYHITPIRTGDPALKCDETIANEPLVADYTYDVEYLG